MSTQHGWRDQNQALRRMLRRAMSVRPHVPLARSGSSHHSVRSVLLDCCIAIGGVALALIVRKLMDPVLEDRNPFITFILAVLVTAWFGGITPALVSMAFGAAAGMYFFVTPRHQLLAHDFPDVLNMLFFCTICGVAIALSEANRRARRRAEEANEALELHQEELERQIADRTAAEQTLRAHEERFRRLSDSNILGIINTDADGRITHANDAFLATLGYERAEFESRELRWQDLTPPECEEADHAALEQLENDGSCQAYEKQFLHRDGARRVPVLFGAARFRAKTDPAGDSANGITGSSSTGSRGSVAFVLDLTALNQARQTLQLQSRVLESMIEGVIVDDVQGRVAFTNPALDHMLGYERGELLGSRIRDLVVATDDEWQDLLEEIRFALRVRASWTGELLNRRKDGSTFTAEAQISAMRVGDTEHWICVQQDVTQRRAAQRAIHEAEERLNLAMAAASMGTWELDPRENRLHASTMMRRVVPDAPDTGWIDMELVYRAVHPDDQQRMRDAIADALAGRREYELEFRGLLPDGRTRWLAARGKVFRDDLGQPTRMTGVTLDVTERRAFETTLKQSEERFRLAAEAVAALIYDWDVTTGKVLRSPGLAKIVGYSPEEVPAKESWWREQLHPDDLPVTTERFNRAIAQGESGYSVEYRVRHRDGSWVHVWDRCLFVHDDAGNPRRVVGSAVNVTELRQAEQELIRRQRELTTLVENSPDMIARLDHDLRSMYVNPSAREVLGVEPEDYVGKTKTELGLPPELQQPWDAACRDAFTSGEKRHIELSYVSARGVRHLQMRLVPEFGPDGTTVESLLSITTDVTEQKRTEAAYRESARWLQLAQEAAASGVWDWHPQTGLMDWSEEFCRIYGIEACKQSTHQQWLSMIHPDDRSRVEALMRAAVDHGNDVDFEFRIIHPQHGERWLTTRGRAVRDDDGQAVRMIGINIDITRRKCAELELQKAKDLAEAADRAKDHFLAVLSHELRTPLTPVLGTVELWEHDPSLSREQREDLEMIRRNIELEARLIDDLLDLTRIARGKIELQIQPCDAHLAIRRAIEICGPELREKKLSVTQDLYAPQSVINADPARLQQIVWNLFKNAVKFTPGGGEIAVQTSIDDGKFIVRVIDNGVGIAAESLEKIFDAFEQAGRDVTRRFGGLGLGLAISKALVEMHGGEIEAQSDGADRGSAFTMKLPMNVPAEAPVVEAAPQDDSSPLEAPPPTERSPIRILLVEDHEDTAVVMARLLRGNNYQVTVAGNVHQALEHASSQPFDLVISDLGLPDGTGHDLMRQLLEKADRIKGIALSGYGMETDLRNSRDAGFAEHLTKPVDAERLEAVIRKVTTGRLVEPTEST